MTFPLYKGDFGDKMIEQPACFGCCVNPNYFSPIIPNFDYSAKLTFGDTFNKTEGLSTEEITLLQQLCESWNMYLSLDKRAMADDQEFLDAIHRTQQIIALRVARRVNPEVWKQP